MTQACADCHTDNREGAKFCKGCGRRLIPLVPTAAAEEQWAATQRMPMHFDLPQPPAPSPRRAPVAAAAPVRASSPRGAPDVKKSAPRPAAPPGSNFLRTAVIGLLVVGSLAAAAGWFLSFGSSRPMSTAASPTAPELPAPALPQAQAAAVESAAPLPEPPTVQAPVQASVATLPAGPSEPTSAPAKPAASKTRKAAVAPVVAAPVAAVPVPQPEPPAPPPPPPPTPQAQCAGLNFIARAQCLAAQCAKPELKAHAQCEAVRRQQQVEEEKRNPTLLN